MVCFVVVYLLLVQWLGMAFGLISDSKLMFFLYQLWIDFPNKEEEAAPKSLVLWYIHINYNLYNYVYSYDYSEFAIMCCCVYVLIVGVELMSCICLHSCMTCADV